MQGPIDWCQRHEKASFPRPTQDYIARTLSNIRLSCSQSADYNNHINLSTTSNMTSIIPSSISSPPSRSYSTWLVFLEAKWVPFDDVNQLKLEQTLTLGGTFVDISDTHFPNVKRVRVFPKNNYLSYLGVKYRLSRIMQPDAWLDHVNLEREARESGYQPNWAVSDK